VRRVLIIVAALAIVLPLGTSLATAAPVDAYNDWTNDQEFNQQHSWADLREAVNLIRIRNPEDTAFQAQMADAVQEEIYHRYLGLETAPAGTLERANLPAWVIALATAATILVLVGVASAIWRRVRPLR